MCNFSVKKPTTINEQIELLKSRGCEFIDEQFAQEILKRVNYYRLTAYFLPFKEKNGDNYVKGTSFEKVFSIYEFDREMRGLLLSIIEEIEIMIRTQISYFHAHKFGALGYENPKNFNIKHNHEKFLSKIKDAVDNNKNLLFVSHHINKYNGRFPIWVISELLTIGDIYYFYSDMHVADRKEFARRYFATSEENLKSWFICLRHIRNCCAHFSRLYYIDFSPMPKTPKNFPIILKKKLFDYLLVLSFLYPDSDKWQNPIFIKLDEIINRFADTVKLDDIGFPCNWQDYLWRKPTNI